MKKLNKKLSCLNASLVNEIILLTGLVVALIGWLGVSDQKFSTILISVGCSLIASSIVSYLSSKYIIRKSKINDIVSNWKLESVYRTRQLINPSCDEKLEELEKHLDIIAFGLKSFRDAKKEDVEEKVEEGINLRILTMDPESDFVRQREIEEKEQRGQIKNTIYQLIEWVEHLKSISPDSENVNIKLYNTMTLDFYFRIDDVIFTGPYLYGIGSQQTITFEYKKGGKGFDYYQNYFENLWQDDKLVKDDYKEFKN